MKKWIPVDSYNLTALEAWLLEMAQSGWRLVKMGSFFASFEPKEPGRLSYHIEPKAEENQEAYADLGWSYVCDMSRAFEIYCTTRKTLKLPSHQEEGLKALRKKQRRAIWNSLLVPLWLVFFTALGTQLYAGQAALVALNDAIIGLYAVLLILSIQEIGMGIRRMRFLKKFAAGEPTSRSKRRSKSVVCILLAALLLAEGGLFLARQLTEREEPIADSEISGFTTMEEVEGVEVAEEFYRKEYGNTVKLARSFLVPVQLEVRQSGRTGSGVEPAMRIRYDEAVSEGMAQSLLTARVAVDLGWNDRIQAAKLEVAGADEAYLAAYQSMQYLFLRRGEKVVSVFYVGEQELSEKAELFEKMLEGNE